MKYAIQGIDGGEVCYWSNEMGWVDCLECATIFTAKERDTFHLPIGEGVKWIKVN